MEKIISGGGVEYVIVSSTRRKGRTYVNIVCPLCSKKDPCLWGDGIVWVTKSSIPRNKTYCMCKRSELHPVKWNTDQYKTKIHRLLLEDGYVLAEDLPEKINTRTIIKLFNPVTGNTWKVVVNNYLYGNKNKDPSLNGRCSDEDRIAHLKSEGLVSESVHLERVPPNKLPESLGQNRYSYWYYTCPVCEIDQFSEAGVSNGTFTVAYASLCKGLVPCRCGKGYRYSEDERRFLIGLKAKQYKLTDIKLSGREVSYKCMEGHSNRKLWNDLSTNGYICKTCASKEPRLFGYYKERAEEQDYFYIATFKEDDTKFKIGRSFNPDKRIKNINKSCKESLELFKVFKGSHKNIYMAEQQTLKYTKDYKVKSEWTHELRSMDCLKEVIDLLEALEETLL